MVASSSLLNFAVCRISRQLVSSRNNAMVSRRCSTKPQDPSQPTSKEMKEAIDLKDAKEKHWEFHQPYNGHAYALKPTQVKCIAGRMYLWCSCGYSKNQVHDETVCILFLTTHSI